MLRFTTRSLSHLRALRVPRPMRHLSTADASSSSTAVAKVPEPTKAAAAPKRGASISQRLTAFTVGVSISLALGYYQLQLDIKNATDSIEQTLHDMRRDTVESQQVIRKKVATLTR